MNILLAGIFAGLGTVVRYLFGRLSARFERWRIPWGTYVVNVFGSFLIGCFFAMHLNDTLYLYLATGFCGGLTTFSTYNFELFAMLEQKKYWTFIKYFLLSYGIGFAACISGICLEIIIS
ncbi:fluoride efflux transporter CrcB [Lactovum odontotermitis]